MAIKVKKTLWEKTLLRPLSTIRDVIFCLNETSLKIVLVADEHGRLLGTISDGDVRRGLIANLDLSDTASSIMQRDPIFVSSSIDRAKVKRLMAEKKVFQIPIIADDNRVLGLYTWEQVDVVEIKSNVVCIMAGGKGTRLMPHTEHLPKPLVKVGNTPMLQLIIERFKADGFRNFVVCVHHLSHMIEEFFGDGRALDVEIKYLREESPLGTAGALGFLSGRISSPAIITNCDVISDITYRDLLRHHEENNAAATMAVRVHEWQNPFGVVELQGIEITAFKEKPTITSHINAGVYVLSPEMFGLMPPGEYCDMPTLFTTAASKGQKTIAYPVLEKWADVGRPEDLQTLAAALKA